MYYNLAAFLGQSTRIKCLKLKTKFTLLIKIMLSFKVVSTLTTCLKLKINGLFVIKDKYNILYMRPPAAGPAGIPISPG